MNADSEVVFFPFAVYVVEQRKLSFKWYQKPTKIETILNFGSCAALQLRTTPTIKILYSVLSSVFFQSTSNWQYFDEANIVNKNIVENSFSRKLVADNCKSVYWKYIK